MKFYFLILFFLPALSYSQEQIGSSIQNRPVNSSNTTAFGLKAGVNIANVDDDQNSSTDSKIGFHVGGLFHIHLGSNFALQPEVTYSRQGTEYPDFGEETINYINIPVLVQYMINGFRIETGPQVGFVTSAKLVRSSGGELDIMDQLKKADFSWSLGVGYITSVGLGIDARYNYGLGNIADDDNHKVMNRVFQIGLFYQFNQ